MNVAACVWFLGPINAAVSGQVPATSESIARAGIWSRLKVPTPIASKYELRTGRLADSPLRKRRCRYSSPHGCAS
jgi:hypothetical protein